MTVNLRSLLEEMIEREASDLHITAGESNGCVGGTVIRTVLPLVLPMKVARWIRSFSET